MNYHIMTFENTHTAIMVQKKIEGLLDFLVCPVLREISASCGIALRIQNDKEDIVKAINHIGLETGIYHLYYVDDKGVEECST